MNILTDDDLRHLYVVFYARLGMCGCGNPSAGIAFTASVLRHFAQPVQAQKWADLEALCGSVGVVQLITGLFEQANLVDHGTSIAYGWLTDMGKWAVEKLRAYPSDSAISVLEQQLDEFGYPHDGEACKPECWTVNGATS